MKKATLITTDAFLNSLCCGYHIVNFSFCKPYKFGVVLLSCADWAFALMNNRDLINRPVVASAVLQTALCVNK